MKKSTILFLTFLMINSFVDAQSYRTTAGLRLGTGSGSGIAVSGAQRIAKHSTIEGIFQPSFNDNSGGALDLLYKQHNKILFKRFNLYTGAGLHKEWQPKNQELTDQADTGFSGIIGGEISFKKLNVSWDYLPSINVMGGKTNFQHQSAITLRMIIVPQKKKKINWKFWKKEKSKKEKRQERREERKKNKDKKEEKKSWWKFWD